MDKTPQFNKEISIILEKMKPGVRKCVQCNLDFPITNLDIDFFKKFKVPEPKRCPECRRQIRLAFTNYTTFFKRDCDVPNHNEKIISTIPKDTSFPVFDFDYYWHGDYNWKNYGIDIDLKKPFEIQFKNLFSIVPQPALTRDPASVNSEYSSYGEHFKNCYYLFGGLNAENIMFSMWPINSRNSLDTLIAQNTDLIYEGVYPKNCYNCNFIYFSKDCLNSSFIYDCRNCTDCFGCVNLRNKKYCFWNKQLSKKEYFKKIEEINLGSNRELDNYKNKFIEFVKSLPIRATRNEHSINVVGNYLINSKNCFMSSWCLVSENLSYTDFVMNNRDCYDCTSSNDGEKLYSVSATGTDCFNVKFSVFSLVLSDCEYTMNCKDSKNLFGCIGIKNGKFCIFNKQYTEEEYWEKLDEIKIKMLREGEYGEFFPISVSPFPYNASLSNIVYNISKKEVLELGGWWYDDEKNLPKNIKLVKAKDLTDDIQFVPDDILNKGILSRKTNKPFKITKEELIFYRRKNLALPLDSPYERIVSRFDFVNNFKIIKDKCTQCGIKIWSSYDSKLGYKPYCEKCYQKEIY